MMTADQIALLRERQTVLKALRSPRAIQFDVRVSSGAGAAVDRAVDYLIAHACGCATEQCTGMCKVVR